MFFICLFFHFCFYFYFYLYVYVYVYLYFYFYFYVYFDFYFYCYVYVYYTVNKIQEHVTYLVNICMQGAGAPDKYCGAEAGAE